MYIMRLGTNGVFCGRVIFQQGTIMKSILLITIVSCLFLSACNDSYQDNSTTELNDLIGFNQVKWKGLDISSYTFTYYLGPNDCPTADANPPVEITVINNTITNLYVPELGTNLDVSSSHYPTIDDVFENMISSIDYIGDAPLFDEHFGYPIHYETDVSVAECDGYSIAISSFI